MSKSSGVDRLVDLSHTIAEGMPVYPGDEIFRHQVVANHDEDGYRVSAFTLGSHLGTHIDFPSHAFIDGEDCLDLPIDTFYGPAVVINLVPFMDDSVPFIIDLDLLRPFKDIFTKAQRVLLRTDWCLRYGEREFYSGFPSLTTEAVTWLANFQLAIIGLESPSLSSLSPDNMPEGAVDRIDVETLHADRTCHRILLGRQPPTLLLEGLTHLHRLPAYQIEMAEKDSSPPLHIAPFSTTVAWDDAKTFTLCCMPLPVRQADGMPVRAFAILP